MRDQRFAMYGKLAVVFGFSAAVLTSGVLESTPGEVASRSAGLVQPNFFEGASKPDAVSRLRTALNAFDRTPSIALAGDVVEAFAALDDHLAELRTKAAKSAGGLRAELEISRIELERERDLHLERFHQASERLSFDAPPIERGENLQFASSIAS